MKSDHGKSFGFAINHPLNRKGRHHDRDAWGMHGRSKRAEFKAELEAVASLPPAPVQLVLPTGEHGIVGVLESAAEGNLRGACRRPGNPVACILALPVVDLQIDAAWGCRRGVEARRNNWGTQTELIPASPRRQNAQCFRNGFLKSKSLSGQSLTISAGHWVAGSAMFRSNFLCNGMQNTMEREHGTIYG